MGITLNIQSLQDNAKANASDGGLNIRAQVSIGTAWQFTVGGNYVGANKPTSMRIASSMLWRNNIVEKVGKLK